MVLSPSDTQVQCLFSEQNGVLNFVFLVFAGIVLDDFKFSVLNTEGAPQNFYDNLPPILAHMEAKNFSYIISMYLLLLVPRN